MAKPKGSPKTGGRVAGKPNKATADVKALAGQYGPAAINTLAVLMVKADTDATKVSAAKELLDRAYGKASQTIAGDPLAPLIVQQIERIIRRPAN